MSGSLEQIKEDASTCEDTKKNTVVARGVLGRLVDFPGFTKEDLLRNTYVVTDDSFPYMVSLETLSRNN